MCEVAEKVIVNICNSIVGGDEPLFATLDDISKQSITSRVNNIEFRELTKNGNFLINFIPDYLNHGYSCRFLDRSTAEQVIILVDTDGKLRSHEYQLNQVDGSTFTEAHVDSKFSTGSIHLQFPNHSIVYSDVKIANIRDVTMGGYTFHIPSFEDCLFDRATYRALFKVVYDISISNEYEDYATTLFIMLFHIDRVRCIATINFSQVNRIFLDQTEVTLKLKFGDMLKIHFGTLAESKKDALLDIITPLIDAALLV